MMVTHIIDDGGGEVVYNKVTVDGNFITANRDGLNEWVNALLDALKTRRGQ